MSYKYLIGVDVGGVRKGFHAATLRVGCLQVDGLIQAKTPFDLVQVLRDRDFAPQVIAIDCPRLCRLEGTSTRLAERQLHRRGIRVQWTRRATHEPPEWMENGEHLWRELQDSFPNATLIECFPTVSSPLLTESCLSLPLSLLGEHAGRRDWKDLIDACICADVARKYISGSANFCGLDAETGETDEIGHIYY